jgi:hypothetical protein
MGAGLGFQQSHLFTPLQALMASREPGGDAFTPAPGGRVLHPHGHSVILVLMAYASLTRSAILEYCYLFRQNESHLKLYIKAKSQSENPNRYSTVVSGKVLRTLF